MKCQNCDATDATIHFKEVKNDQVREMHLCESCAREKGFHRWSSRGSSPSASQFIWMAENLYPERGQASARSSARAAGCGTASSRRSGRLGCPDCYNAFGRHLKQVLRRVHGSVRHSGKVPGHPDESSERRTLLQKLREELERAVEREEYEQAARLRDRIREIESLPGDQVSPAPAADAERA